MGTDSGKSPGPDCYKCRHFVITYEKKRPYACEAMGFKSKEIPSVVVRRVSGKPCLAHEPKPASWPGWGKGGDGRRT